MHLTARLWAPLLFASAAFGQPFISPKGILNAASFAGPGIPNGAIARGSVFSIFGRSLGPAAGAQVSAFPLGTAFQGVSIRVTQGATVVDAIPIYVAAGQINAILPSNAPLGMASLQVTFNGTRSNLAPFRVAANSPGLFTATGYGAGPGIFQNYVEPAIQPINSSTATAKPAQIVTLWGTGLGAIAAPDNVAPPTVNVAAPVEVWVGGKRVSNILYSGRTPCCSGVDQIVFEMPADVPEGCFVPVILKAGDAVSNTVTVAVEKAGNACADAGNPLATSLAAGKKTGLALASRVQLRADVGLPVAKDFIADFASVYLTQPSGVPFAFDPLVALPPAGTCTAYTANGDLLGGDSLIRGAGKALDAGAVTISGARGSTPVTGSVIGVSGDLPGAAALPLFFDSGSVTLRAVGGADLGAFTTSLTPAVALTWGNRDSLDVVDRKTGVTVNFGGGAGRTVVIGGIGSDPPNNASAMFLCVAPLSASSFTVPPEFLANLPATRTTAIAPAGVLFLGVLSTPQTLQPTGLDTGFAAAAHVTAKTVIFR